MINLDLIRVLLWSGSNETVSLQIRRAGKKRKQLFPLFYGTSGCLPDSRSINQPWCGQKMSRFSTAPTIPNR